MNINGEAKVLIGIGVATLVILVGGVFLMSSSTSTSSPSSVTATGEKVDQKVLIRKDSYKKEVPNAKVTIVEFLDFECEACYAAYPTVKQILEEYDGKVTFVVRNFPLHKNSVLAAKAAEAAGAQGKFWEMYAKLFENQKMWSEKAEPQSEIFIGFAEELGLDMDKFEDELNNKAYEDKVNRDKNDGITAGVQGTPTFFINGKLAGNVMSYDEFKAKIDSELEK